MEIEKTLIKISETTGGRISKPDTYSDFLAYCALLLSSRTDPVHTEQRLRALKQLQEKYSDSEWQVFHQGLEALCSTVSQNTLAGRFDDLFAKTYMQLGASSRALKQDFTPPDLARLISNITFHPGNTLPQKGFFDIGDHACGSGTLLLTAAESIAEKGFNPSAHLAVQAADLDIRCVHMAFLNLSLYGIPAVVIHGNALSLEEHDRWYTPAYLLGRWIWRAPMPFGEGGYASDEMLKRIDEPMYGVIRQIEALFSPVHIGGTADRAKIHTENDEVQA